MAHSITWTCDACGTTHRQGVGRLPPAGWLTLAITIVGDGEPPHINHLCPACGVEGFPGLATQIALQRPNAEGHRLVPGSVEVPA